jgi:hypothetical protein
VRAGSLRRVLVACAVVVLVAPPSGWSPSIVKNVASAAPLKDWVEELPGLDRGDPPVRTPTPHFSGYLDATAGCDTDSNGKYCKLHYWLALAEGPNPETKPVVLWLNGTKRR